MRCKATKRDGTPCTLPARGSNGLCWAHSPEHAERRRKAASKGGKSRRGGEIVEVKARIRELAEAAIEGKVDRGRASVAFQGLGVLKGFLELERKVRETEELAKRLEALEERQAALRYPERGAGTRWRV